MSDYERLMKEYYRFEDFLLKETVKRLASAETPEARDETLRNVVDRFRGWMIENFQSQDRRAGEMEQALSEARSALTSAQERMEELDRESKLSAAAAPREASRPLSPPPKSELEKRLGQQEELLKKREEELLGLRLKLDASRRELDSLLERLKAQEAAAKPESPRPDRNAALELELAGAQELLKKSEEENAVVKTELEQLRERLVRAEAGHGERDAQAADLADRLREAQTQNAGLNQRLEALRSWQETVEQTAAQNTGAQSQRIRERLSEAERTLRARDAELDALQRQLQQTQSFSEGFLRRIQALETERATAQKRLPPQPPKPPPSTWETERRELQERVQVLQRDLANMRRTAEAQERHWIQTMTSQDMQRLKEIDLLKAETERLRTKLARRQPRDPAEPESSPNLS